MAIKFSDSEEKWSWEQCSCGHYMELRRLSLEEDINIEDFSMLGDKWLYVENVEKCPSCEEFSVYCYKGFAFTGEERIEHEYRVYQISKKFKVEFLYYSFKKRKKALPAYIWDIFDKAHELLEEAPQASFILTAAVLKEICNNQQIPTQGLNKSGKRGTFKLVDRLYKLFEQREYPIGLLYGLRRIEPVQFIGAYNFKDTVMHVSAQDAYIFLSFLEQVFELTYIKDRYTNHLLNNRITEFDEADFKRPRKSKIINEIGKEE